MDGGLVIAGWKIPGRRDPRWPFAFLLTLYCVLGFLFFGFNRTPAQMFFIMASGAVLDAALTWISRREKVVPLSSWITCCSLAILLNYSKHSVVLFLPVLLAIGSKHVLTFDGKHVFNPSMFGVAVSLLVASYGGGEVITAAPAYQWANSSLTVTFFLVTAAAALFIWRIGRGWLIVSFIAFYALNTAIRAYVMRHHLPPEMLFLGTMLTPPFYLFTLYMITDPATSPKKPAMQVLIAFAIAAVDLVLHTKESVYTFFYAALIVGTGRYFIQHARKILALGPGQYFRSELDQKHRRAILAVAVVAVLYAAVAMVAVPRHTREPGFTMERVQVPAAASEMSDVLHEIDPRVQHVGKWLLSVGDAVAAGDVDNDGDVDLFLSNPMKRPGDRAALLLNEAAQGRPWSFARFPLPALDERVHDPKRFGLPSGGTFADWDGDGDLDLAVPFGFGKMRLLENQLHAASNGSIGVGALAFVDATEALGVDEHTVSLAITFFDVENDGDLDMLVLNATAPTLNDYDPPRPLNVFALPAPEHAGDRRMLHFMHDGWHDANNGGGQVLFLNEPRAAPDDAFGGTGATYDGPGATTAAGPVRFVRQDGPAWGLISTRWSLAAALVDFNHDGFTDVYVANDFGPDELLLNEKGARFRSIRGTMFNEVGHDTYKGMNASMADFDRNGFIDVTVSNVHHALQAEGSMLWMVYPPEDGADAFVPRFVDEATERGALNERRFGWGAAAGDIDNDGWPDLVQASGMLDDRLDRDPVIGDRKDYWYVNHKLMQSGPEIHTYADMWGDLRGRTIYPNEARRAYLNLGDSAPGHFVDVAEALGIAEPDNSRGVLLSDLDLDGDLDIVVANQHAPASIYRSQLRETVPARAHWIAFDLRGARANTRGIGAVVRVSWTDPEAPGGRVELVQENAILAGFSSAKDPRVHFGIGARPGPVDVSVRWPGGAVTEATLEADRVHVLTEGAR